MPTPREVWEALDEVNSTGELYEQPDMEAYLAREGLIRVDDEDAGYEMTEKAQEFYDKGYPL